MYRGGTTGVGSLDGRLRSQSPPYLELSRGALSRTMGLESL
jgi:hypothetical protein